MNEKIPHLLGLSGSLRTASFNTAILSTIAQRVADRAELAIFPLNEIPLYDQDADTETPPPAVTALREAIAGSDGLIIASPEYNHGISGVLKNALDWASRPYGRASLPGKPVVTLTSSPAFTGGVRAQAQLDQTLRAIGARMIIRPQIVIGSVHEKVIEGRFDDEASLRFLDQAVADLIAAITPAP